MKTNPTLPSSSRIGGKFRNLEQILGNFLEHCGPRWWCPRPLLALVTAPFLTMLFTFDVYAFHYNATIHVIHLNTSEGVGVNVGGLKVRVTYGGKVYEGVTDSQGRVNPKGPDGYGITDHFAVHTITFPDLTNPAFTPTTFTSGGWDGSGRHTVFLNSAALKGQVLLEDGIGLAGVSIQASFRLGDASASGYTTDANGNADLGPRHPWEHEHTHHLLARSVHHRRPGED